MESNKLPAMQSHVIYLRQNGLVRMTANGFHLNNLNIFYLVQPHFLKHTTDLLASITFAQTAFNIVNIYENERKIIFGFLECYL